MTLPASFRRWSHRLLAPGTLLRGHYDSFRKLLEHDKRSHELVSELEQLRYEGIPVDLAAIQLKYNELSSSVLAMTQCLEAMCHSCYPGLDRAFQKIDSQRSPES